MRTYWVYIMASRSRNLYIGVTNNITKRVVMHRAGDSVHTNRYRLVRLVYAESTYDVRTAIQREKQIKGWLRRKKLALIESQNPTWKDFAEGWENDPVLR